MLIDIKNRLIEYAQGDEEIIADIERAYAEKDIDTLFRYYMIAIESLIAHEKV
ncbi:MAG: hypothetical protein HUJ56_01875 [Erysipelotrichaceae bacterium]|nr:hypothetical protein [Erysipelotrichaceae bacterium]